MIEIDIKVQKEQNGYDLVDEYIRRYWKYNGLRDVVISLGISYDGESYNFFNVYAFPCSYDNIEYMNDWWEGQKYIKLFGIQGVDELNIQGGLYK